MYRTHYFDISLPFESNIPFIPFFITGYTSVYVILIILYTIFDDFEYFKKAMYFFFVVTTVHFIFFILFPVKMTRPDLTQADGIMTALTHYYYLIDNPVNCFPSLHISYPLAGTLIIWNYKRKWTYVFAALTVFIAVSVLLVKQHYFLDVAGAVAATGIIYAILKRRSKL